jgi:glycosyltransferase involved in cell wall biosynthesis
LLDTYRARLGGRCELHLVTRTPLEATTDVHVYRDVAPNSELLKRLYATADLFVLPTLADCFPLVIQEAMAAGLPVVATDVGAIGEAVRDGENGLLVPPGDARALGAALDALVDDSARRRAMGTRGRALAEQKFDSAANARRILSVMTALKAA